MSQTPLYGITNSVNSGSNRRVKHQQQHIIQSPNTRVPNIDMLSYNSNNSNNNNNSVNSNITVVTEAGGNSYAVTNTTLDQTTSISNHNTNTGAIPKEKSAKNSNKPQQPRKPPPTIETFWPNILQEVQNAVIDSKHQSLPLARIKKIMKLDENAKMIAAEAPTLFAKACEFFIQELTMRAWIHTDESKRRTLQRSDIAQAIANYDQFDFLIDIVPREDIKPPSHRRHHHETASSTNNPTNSSGTQSPANNTMTTTVSNVVTGEILNVAGLPLDNITTAQPTTATIAGNLTQTQPATQMLNAAAAAATSANHNTPQLQIIQQAAHPQQHLQYFITIPGQQPGQAQLVHQLQLQQQQQQHLNNGLTTAGAPLTTASLNLVAQQPQQLILTAANPSAAHAAANVVQHQQQTALLQNIAQQQQQQHAPQQQVQLLQQVMLTPNGEITNMPIAINANQLNLLRLQMHQHQQQQQQQQQHQQQVIIPTHLLTAQQLLQLQAQQNHAQANTATTTHIVHHQPQHQVVQQQQTHQHQQQQQTQLHPQTTTNNIYINSNAIATNPPTTGTTVAAGSSMVSTDRNMGSTFRNNC